MNTAPDKRWRPQYLRDMLNLQVGEYVEVYPEADDTIDALFPRLRRQADRYRLLGMHFHLNKRRGHAFVQRVDESQKGKLAPFWRLKVGEKMRCGDPFGDDLEKKRLRRRLLYLAERGKCIWLERHAGGMLYYRCFASSRDDRGYWWESLEDDGTDFQDAELVCCPLDLAPAKAEFWRMKAKILNRRRKAMSIAA